MMTRGMLGRILAMAVTGAALSLATAWSFGAFAAPTEHARFREVALQTEPPCTRSGARGIFVHVRHHLARHLHHRV